MSQGARPTFQKRSEKTRDKLVNALEKLLYKKSFEDISIQEIAKGAGVSPASIYRRFKNKEAFIPVLFEIYLQRLEEWSKNPSAQIDLENMKGLKDVLKAVSKVAWTQLTQQAHIMRAVYIHARLQPDLMGEELKKWERQSLKTFEGIINYYKAEVKRPDIKKASKTVSQLFHSIFIDFGLFEKPSTPLEFDRKGEELCDEVALMAYGYLILPE